MLLLYKENTFAFRKAEKELLSFVTVNTVLKIFCLEYLFFKKKNQAVTTNNNKSLKSEPMFLNIFHSFLDLIYLSLH